MPAGSEEEEEVFRWEGLRLFWRRFPPPQRWAAVVVLAGGGILLLAFAMPWSDLADIAGSAASRREQKRGLAPLVERARLRPMTYETAEAGRPVVWCVDHPASGVSYLSGRPSEPLVWVNDADLPLNSPTTGGRCTTVVAVVEDRRPGGLVLRYVGTP